MRAARNREATILICDQCGATIPKHSKFCPECGAPVAQRAAPRVRVREEYAQRVFTFGCLITTLIAVIAGFIVGLISKALGVFVALSVLLTGVVFMKILFSRPPR